MLLSTNFNRVENNVNLPLNHNLLAGLIKHHPQQIAVIDQERVVTYQELDEMSDRIAQSWLELGLKKGDRIALHLPNSIELIVSYFACFKIGTIAVPLNNRLKASELSYVINHSGSKFYIGNYQLYAEVKPIQDELININYYYLIDPDLLIADPLISSWENLLNQPNNLSLPNILAVNPAVILYTSGTTAKPKGVTHSYHSIERTIYYYQKSTTIKSTDMVIGMLPMYHIFGFALQLLVTLSVGATIIILPQFQSDRVLETLNKYPITRTYGLPVMYNALVNHPQANQVNCPTWKLGIAGGDAVPVSLQNQIKEVFGVTILEGSGMTEVIPYSINYLEQHRLGSIGLPSQGMELKIVDHQGLEVKTGKVGEILVKSDAMMIGYWQNDLATHQTIIDGWLHTGDLAYQDPDGYYWFVSRLKEIIIRGGSNISPLEVEAVIYQHPKVQEVGVVGVPNQELGEVVYAFVSLKSEFNLSTTDLQDFISQKIASYKVPEKIIFLPELPKGLTGKIHRQTLKNMAIKLLENEQ